MHKEEIPYDILWEDQDKGLWWSFKQADVVKHIEIKRTGSAFTVDDTKINFTETSIEEAVKHLKRAHDVENLGDQKSGATKEEEKVLLQPKPDKKKLSYDDSGTSSMHPNEPFRLQAFHGTMSALNAEEELIDRLPSSFLLRRSLEGSYWISYRTLENICHLPIERDNGLYKVIHFCHMLRYNMTLKLDSNIYFRTGNGHKCRIPSRSFG